MEARSHGTTENCKNCNVVRQKVEIAMPWGRRWEIPFDRNSNSCYHVIFAGYTRFARYAGIHRWFWRISQVRAEVIRP